MQVLDIIRQIIAEKCAASRHPVHALRMEVMRRIEQTPDNIREMDAQIAELLRTYEIIDYRTACDTAYTVTDLHNGKTGGNAN